MTQAILVQIVIGFLIFVGVSGLFLLVFIFGRSTIKDNPAKAFIFVANGHHIPKPIKGKLMETSQRGSTYEYGKKHVFVPYTYEEHYHRGRRALFVARQGQLIASPFKNDVNLSPAERENLIYELVSGHIGADALRALRGKTGMNVIIIAVIAFIIGAVAILGFNQFQKSRQPVVQSPATIEQPIPTPTPTPEIIWEAPK